MNDIERGNHKRRVRKLIARSRRDDKKIQELERIIVRLQTRLHTLENINRKEDE